MKETRETAERVPVFVVRDAAGEYLRADGSRTPASDEAHEFATAAEAAAACTRATDKVVVW